MNIINNGNSFLLLKSCLTFAAGIKNKIDIMNTIIGKKEAVVSNKKLSDALFILWAGGAALLSYSLVYALRKPFTAATFDGLDFFGMDYKTATSIIQISGYFISKLIGIKVISELKKENRLKFIILFGRGRRTVPRSFRSASAAFQCIRPVLQRAFFGMHVGSDFQFSGREAGNGFAGQPYGTEHRYQLGHRKVDRTFCDG